MTEYCRLCADLKGFSEIVASIDDVDLLMEQKLRVCCQWAAENIQHQLPHSVCSICLDKLDKCWLFSQSVQLAQQRLLEIFENGTAIGVVPLETVILPPIYEPSEYSPDSPSISDVQSNNTFGETDTHRHRQQEYKAPCKTLIVPETIAVDLKPTAVDSTDFQCDIGSDEYQGFDSDSNADDTPTNFDKIQTVPSQINPQPGNEIKSGQKKRKPIKKIDKTKPSNEEEAAKKQHACTECGQTFSCTTNLKKHQHVHTGQKPFECPLCSKSYLAQYALNQHLLSHVQRSKGELKIEETTDGIRLIQPSGDHSIKIPGHIWKCDRCDRIFTQRYKLKYHQLLQHTSQLPYECWLCHKLFKTHARVKAHIKTHIPDAIKLNWICELCGKGFGGPLALSNHAQMIHSKERPWRCETCGLGFKVECQLRRHHLTHSDVQHKCNHCEKTFRTTYSLKKHLETHTGVILRPFVCDFCKVGFRHKMDLKEHRRIHTGEKPYKCERCLSNFRAASTFYNHMRKIHGISMSQRKKKFMAE